MGRTVTGSEWYNFPGQPTWFEFWDDFLSEEGVTNFTSTAIASGATAVTTDEKFGVLSFANNGTDDNSGAQIQGDMEMVSLATGKKTDFMARFQASDVDASSFFLGLSITDTSIQHATTDTLAGGLTITDGIGFYSPDTEGNIYGVIRRGSVQANTGSLASLADATYATLSFRVEMDASTAGKGTVYFYKDGVLLGSLTSTTMPYDSEEILTPSIAWKTTAASAQTAKADFCGARQER